MNLLDLLIPVAHAQAAPASAGAGDAFSPLILLLVFFGVFYFIVLRPQMKRAKEHRQLLSQLAKGDEVVAAGGLLGRVVEIGDSFVGLELAPNLSIKVQKQSITAVLPKGSLKSA
jgi:preprotein translocase subunit YajC